MTEDERARRPGTRSMPHPDDEVPELPERDLPDVDTPAEPIEQPPGDVERPPGSGATRPWGDLPPSPAEEDS